MALLRKADDRMKFNRRTTKGNDDMTDNDDNGTAPGEFAPPAWWPAEQAAAGWVDDPDDYWHVPVELRAAYAAVPLTDDDMGRWIGGARAITSQPAPARPLPAGFDVQDAGGVGHPPVPHAFIHVRPGLDGVRVLMHSHALREARDAVAAARQAAIREAQDRRVCAGCGLVSTRYAMVGLRLLPAGVTLPCCVPCRDVLRHAFTTAHAARVTADGRSVAERAAAVAAAYPDASGTLDTVGNVTVAMPPDGASPQRFVTLDPVTS